MTVIIGGEPVRIVADAKRVGNGPCWTAFTELGPVDYMAAVKLPLLGRERED